MIDVRSGQLTLQRKIVCARDIAVKPVQSAVALCIPLMDLPCQQHSANLPTEVACPHDAIVVLTTKGPDQK